MGKTTRLGWKHKQVSTVTAVGRSLYILLPQQVCELAGLKRGDRMVIETDGRMVYATRIPFEELIRRRKPLEPVELKANPAPAEPAQPAKRG